MSASQADQLANLRNFIRTNRRSRRKYHHAIAEFFGFRQQQSAMRKMRPVRLHVMHARIKVTPGQYVLGKENLDQFVSRQGGSRRIKLDDNILEIALLG